MKFTKQDLDVLLLKPMDTEEGDFIVVDPKEQDDILITIDSNEDAELIIATRDDYLKYQFFTTDCIEELRFLTNDGCCYLYNTVWNEEHGNYNTYEYITHMDDELSYLYISKKEARNHVE